MIKVLRGEEWRGRGTGQRPRGGGGRVWRDTSITKRCLALGAGGGEGLLPEPSEGARPCDTLVSDLASRTVRGHTSAVLSHPVCDDFSGGLEN